MHKMDTGNAIHDRVAKALNVFERCLHDSPKIDPAWARDLALRAADITPSAFPQEYDNFMHYATQSLVKHMETNP